MLCQPIPRFRCAFQICLCALQVDLQANSSSVSHIERVKLVGGTSMVKSSFDQLLTFSYVSEFPDIFACHHNVSIFYAL